MRLLTFVADGHHRLGLEVDGKIVCLRRAWENLPRESRGGLSSLPSTMIEFLTDGEPAMAAAKAVQELVQAGGSAGKQLSGKGGEPIVFSADQVKIAAPIARPGKIICLGLNYADHAAESHQQLPPVPVLFAKFANTIVGPGDAVVLPKASNAVDYEAEMAFVVGKVARNVPLDKAYDFVAGYMNLNDISARDHQLEISQWVRGKSADTFAPTGPFIATKDEVPDPQTLDIRLWLNGELMQSSNTRHLIFDVPFLVHHITKTITLEPGDIISTGTPSGVGFVRNPQVLLKPGDVVRLEVAGLGVLENTVVGEE